MRVDIWSDLVCPWCYAGEARFENALGTFAHRDEVKVDVRADEDEARRLGISGARATETFSQALEQAWPQAAG